MEENKKDHSFIIIAIIILFIMLVSNGNANAIGSKYPVTQQEYVLLCNLLANEYGADSIPVPEKARVVQTVINRLNSPDFPNTIEGVISQPGQFAGYVPGYELSDSVTESVKQAVKYCLNGSCSQETALFYWGDGERNHFYDTYEEWERTYYSQTP